MISRDLDRLYEYLPAHIRVEDIDQGLPLKAFMRLLNQELDIVEEDIEQLYENWFIETSEEWVISYIGDLIGTRKLRPYGNGGMLRAYVANTLNYRRAKGTLSVIERLAEDVTSWSVHVVEFFRLLIQNQQLNHLRLNNLSTVNLHDANSASLAGDAFENLNHNIEIRSSSDMIHAPIGRYNLPNLGIYVWRLQSYFYKFVYGPKTGYCGGVIPKLSTLGPAGLYHIDPIGRDIPLINREIDEANSTLNATQRGVPAFLKRRVLFEDLNLLQGAAPAGGKYFNTLPVFEVRLDNILLDNEKLHCCCLDERTGPTWRRPEQQGEVLFDPELGRLSLHPDDESKSLEISYANGFVDDVGAGIYDRCSSIETWLNRFEEAEPTFLQIGVTRRQQELNPTQNHEGLIVKSLAEAIVIWNNHVQNIDNASGIICIMDNATYDESLQLVHILAGAKLVIVSADWPSTLVSGQKTREAKKLIARDRRPIISATLKVKGEVSSDLSSSLIVDGLLIEGDLEVTTGHLSLLEVRHSTVGVNKNGLTGSINIKSGAHGKNEQLSIHIERTISGRLLAKTVSSNISIIDTIISEQDKNINSGLVINTPNADLNIQQTTIYGEVTGRSLNASNCIFMMLVNIARRQNGCIRFSYVAKESQTPRRYKCVPDLSLANKREKLSRQLTDQEINEIYLHIRPRFTDTTNDAPAFSQLSQDCSLEISEGGEGGRAMGVYFCLGEPFRKANLNDALDEYLPLGLKAKVIFVT